MQGIEHDRCKNRNYYSSARAILAIAKEEAEKCVYEEKN